MIFSLSAVVAALASGSSFVPHAAGGMIASGAGGYIAGTYLSTATIGVLVASGGMAATATIVVGAYACLSFVGLANVGSAGLMGSTMGASGMTGWAMSHGLMASTPLWIPYATIAAGVAIPLVGGALWLHYRSFNKLQEKLQATLTGPTGIEAQFTHAEAQLFESGMRTAILRLS